MVRKLLILLGALAGLAVICIGIAWFLLGNEPFLKKQLHDIVFKKTGRSFLVDGPLSLDLGSETTFEAHNIRFVNASWAENPDMAEVGRLLVSFDLRSLFDDVIVLRAVEIGNCRLELIENRLGVANWDVLPKSESENPKQDSGPQEPPWKLHKVSINNCHISSDSPRREHPLQVEITELRMDLQDDGKYQKHARGVIDGMPLSFEGNFGPVRALWQGGRFDHEIKLLLGKTELRSSGSVADAKTGTGANISMHFTGPDIGHVIRELALPPISTGAFDFELNLNTEGSMTLVDVDGDLGSLDAKAEGKLDRLLRPSTGQLKLTLTGPNLGALAEVFGADALVPDAFTLGVNATVENGRTQLAPLNLKTDRDQLEIRGTLGAQPDFATTDLDITFHSDEADRWMPALGVELGPIGTLDIKGKLATDSTSMVRFSSIIDQARNYLEASGTLGVYPNLDQPDLSISLDSADLQALGVMLKVKKLPPAPFKISGHIQKEAAGLRLGNVKADLAGNLFQIDGLVNRADQFRGSTINMQADVPSTTALGALFNIKDLPDQPLKLKSVIRPAGKGLKFKVTDGQLGEMKIELDGQLLDLETPGSIDASFNINLPSLALLGFLVPEMELPDLPVSASGELKHGTGSLQLKQTRLKLGSSEAQVDANLQLSESLVGSQATLSASGTDYREFISFPKLESLPHDFLFSGQWSRDEHGDNLENVRFDLGKMSLTLSGNTNDLAEIKRFNLNTQTRIPDVSLFNTLLNQSFDAEPLSVDAHLEGTPETFVVSNLAARLGASHLKGDLLIDRSRKLQLSGNLESDHLDLAYLTSQQGTTDGNADSLAPAAKDTSAKQLFDDTPVKAMEDSPINIDLSVTVARVDLGNTEINNVRLGIFWQDHLLKLDPFDFGGSRGSHVSGEVTLDGRETTPKLDISLQGKDIRLGLAAPEGQDPATYPPLELELKLNGVGSTQHEVANSMNGNVRIYIGSGLIASHGGGLFFSDFITELFSALNPFSKSGEYTKLECGVMAADVVSGQVEVKPIIFQLESMTIVSDGNIDLESEKLNLVFNTKPRKGFGISAGVIINSLIKVGGTLSAPAVELNPSSAVLSGGTAVATLGVSLLAKSFTDRFLSSKDPCGDARKKLEESDTRQ